MRLNGDVEQELEVTNEQLMAPGKRVRNTNRELSIANRELVESREKLLRLATAIEQAQGSSHRRMNRAAIPM